MTTRTLQTSGGTFVRSQDGMIAGVCQALGTRFGIDPWVVRIIWLISIIAFGTGLFLYAIAAICFPREDELAAGQQRRLLGVCSRISTKTGIEVGLVRLAAVLSLVLSFGLTTIGYFVAHYLIEADESRVL